MKQAQCSPVCVVILVCDSMAKVSQLLNPFVPFCLDHLSSLSHGCDKEDEEKGKADFPCVIREQRQEADSLHCQECVQLGRISPLISWQIISFIFSVATINILEP